MSGDFDPEAFYEQTGIDTRLAQPFVEPPLSSAGAHAQAELLQRLAGIRATIEIIESLVRNHPNNDAAFDTLNANFGQSLEDARAAFQRFRERRECKGAS